MKHNFHILSPSSYPYLLFLVLSSLTSMVVIYFKYGFNLSILLVCFIMILLMFAWFKDIIMEGLCGLHNFQVQDGLKLGMILFIFSELMFFFGIFWLFFDTSLNPASDVGEVWSPLGLIPLNPFGVPLLNSMILLSSGVSVTWCHYGLLSNKCSSTSLMLTILLAIYFLVIQNVEYYEAYFTISDSVFGSIFFLSTGFHGVHVLLGGIFLTFNYIRLVKNQFTFNHHLGLEFSILYWHFVDVVWLFLFVFVYWWSY